MHFFFLSRAHPCAQIAHAFTGAGAGAAAGSAAACVPRGAGLKRRVEARGVGAGRGGWQGPGVG